MNTNADQISISEGFSPSSLTGPPAEPRLGIRHLMLWTALSAVLLVVMQIRQWADSTDSAWAVLLAIGPAAAAAAFTVIAVRLVWWRTLHVRWLREPGHGIALLIATKWLAAIPWRVLDSLYLTQHSDGTTTFDVHFLADAFFYGQCVYATGALLAGLFSIGMAIWLAKDVAWRFFFAAMPLVYVRDLATSVVLARVSTLAFFVSHVGWLVGAWPNIVLLLLLVTACVRDKKRRHWTHWWGVLAFVAPLVSRFIGLVIYAVVGGSRNL